MLQDHPLYAYLPAADVARARRFYEQTLGFEPGPELAGGVTYRFGNGTAAFLYPTENAGSSKASQAFWQVDDIEREVATLKQRGVVFDVGHGGGSFDYTVAEAAMAAGAGPDTISSDIHVFSGNSPGMPYLTWVMSKFLNLGMSLEQVVTLSTAAPAQAINRVPKLGTLQIGAPADLSLVEVVEGPIDFVDTRQNRRTGQRWIKPMQTVKAGRPFGRPYPTPFAWP